MWGLSDSATDEKRLPLKVAADLHEHDRLGARFMRGAGSRTLVRQLFARPTTLILDVSPLMRHMRVRNALDAAVSQHPERNVVDARKDNDSTPAEQPSRHLFATDAVAAWQIRALTDRSSRTQGACSELFFRPKGSDPWQKGALCSPSYHLWHQLATL